MCLRLTITEAFACRYFHRSSEAMIARSRNTDMLLFKPIAVGEIPVSQKVRPTTEPMNGSVSVGERTPSAHRAFARRRHQLMFKKVHTRGAMII